MKLSSHGPLLSAIFVDYDNIYLSLKRKNEEAAKRFAKDAHVWLKAIETGRLITPTNGPSVEEKRRIVSNRCYGNPVPRRNNTDNATDTNSFPFMRHHFLRTGFELVECAPLTASFKNSADIRMVMDVIDFLAHDTRVDEFIILSGDADFTPVLHRLRTHARRTVVFANEYTATPYKAISDGEIRETDLVSFLLDDAPVALGETPDARVAISSGNNTEMARHQIIAEVTSAVRSAGQPVSLEALADRAVRALGHEKTIGSSWGGAGSFRELLLTSLPEPIRLSDQAPFIVFEAAPKRDPEPSGREIQVARPQSAAAAPALPNEDAPQSGSAFAPSRADAAVPARVRAESLPHEIGSANLQRVAGATRADGASAIQHSIARIHEACKAPPLSPPDYRLLFNVMAQEINAHGPNGAQTIANILQRAREEAVEFRRDDVRFVLEVVGEADPWFEQGASPNVFAGRFRNFVVGRCRAQGLNLSSEELDLIEAWFAGQGAATRRATASIASASRPQASQTQDMPAQTHGGDGKSERERWWNIDDSRQLAASLAETKRTDGGTDEGEEFPRIVRSRLRG